jgi:hypothetical protein
VTAEQERIRGHDLDHAGQLGKIAAAFGRAPAG